MTKKVADQTINTLDMRSRDIFRLIVENYLHEGDPLGSSSLARILPQKLSAATIRNVMGDLEQLGLIYSPHVSAGRLPTQLGLRFFVDAFMEIGELSENERKIIEAKIELGGRHQSMEHLLTEASQMLSGLSRGAGLVLAAKSETPLKHIEFIQLEPNKALAIMVSKNGDVENRIMDLPAGVTTSQLVEASNYLNSHIRGLTIGEARAEIERLREQTQFALDELSQTLVDRGLAIWSGKESGSPQLIVRGWANLLENVTAQTDFEMLRHLFEDLETTESIVQLLDFAEEGPGVRIFIGSENKLFSLSGSSLVVAPYKDENSRIVGALGIIGPTRLNYARIVPMVDYTANLIGRILR